MLQSYSSKTSRPVVLNLERASEAHEAVFGLRLLGLIPECLIQLSLGGEEGAKMLLVQRPYFENLCLGHH